MRRAGSDVRLREVAAELLAGPPEPLRTVSVARVPSRGRASFQAGLLRQAYGTGWLPPSVARNIRHVDVDGQAGAVRLTLSTGAVLVDLGDRIVLRGRADDVGVVELVACVERRGWQSVELTGDAHFRAEAVRRLMRLVPPVDVVNNPLAPSERAAIRIEAAGDEAGVEWDALQVPAPAYAPRL